jgi:hypothetical protein
MSDTIRLFVGTSARNEDLEAEMVLEYSARKFCSLPLEITWMRQAKKGPWSGWASSANSRTPFTAYRWSIPSVCGYEGRAIYTDVDFLFCADLAELWTQPIPGVALVRNATGKLSTSCILFDNARAKKHVPPVEELRQMADAHGVLLNYFRKNPQLLAPCAGNWDCPDLKGYQLGDPEVKAIHFTRIETQLHLKHAIPRLKSEGGSHWYTEAHEHPRPELQAHFDALLADALAAGYTLDQYRGVAFDAATRKDFKYSHHVETAKVQK